MTGSWFCLREESLDKARERLRASRKPTREPKAEPREQSSTEGSAADGGGNFRKDSLRQGRRHLQTSGG